MKVPRWIKIGGLTLGAIGLGLAVESFLPQRWNVESWFDTEKGAAPYDSSKAPHIDVTFMRCGKVTIPEPVAVRGAFSLAPRVISHSAVLIRHPKATFLYDTGLCSDIVDYVETRSFLFRQTLGRFELEKSLGAQLKMNGIGAGTLDFALLSHLHWDHVSGVPDIPGVPLHIHRVEFDAAREGILDMYNGLTRDLLSDNPIQFFECNGPEYEGFSSSYDLFGDGSIVLVPLPGHTAGNVGMFINRSNGPRVFLIGDAAWVDENYLRPTTMHPFIWLRVTWDDATARQTLIQLHHFAKQHPAIPMIAMHDAASQEQFMERELARKSKIEMA